MLKIIVSIVVVILAIIVFGCVKCSKDVASENRSGTEIGSQQELEKYHFYCKDKDDQVVLVGEIMLPVDFDALEDKVGDRGTWRQKHALYGYDYGSAKCQSSYTLSIYDDICGIDLVPAIADFGMAFWISVSAAKSKKTLTGQWAKYSDAGYSEIHAGVIVLEKGVPKEPLPQVSNAGWKVQRKHSKEQLEIDTNANPLDYSWCAIKGDIKGWHILKTEYKDRYHQIYYRFVDSKKTVRVSIPDHCIKLDKGKVDRIYRSCIDPFLGYMGKDVKIFTEQEKDEMCSEANVFDVLTHLPEGDFGDVFNTADKESLKKYIIANLYRDMEYYFPQSLESQSSKLNGYFYFWDSNFCTVYVSDLNHNVYNKLFIADYSDEMPDDNEKLESDDFLSFCFAFTKCISLLDSVDEDVIYANERQLRLGKK
ncbi:MAG: hypothetical protein JEZ07_17710 [Phycisphaerae bacterium]|nr:hypothetical protein [Phycisphaerae bacterium]